MCEQGVWVRRGCVLTMSISSWHTPVSPLFFPEETCEKEVWIVSNLKKIGRRSRTRKLCVGVDVDLFAFFVGLYYSEKKGKNRFPVPRMTLKNRDWYRTFALCTWHMICVFFSFLGVLVWQFFPLPLAFFLFSCKNPYEFYWKKRFSRFSHDFVTCGLEWHFFPLTFVFARKEIWRALFLEYGNR